MGRAKHLVIAGISAALLLVVLVAVVLLTTLGIERWREQRVAFQNVLTGPDYSASAGFYLNNAARLSADTGDLIFRVVFIGDAGLPLPGAGYASSDGFGDPSLFNVLTTWTSERPHFTKAIFLGDNIYPEGYLSDEAGYAQHVLDTQIKAGGEAPIFIPGNHDWGNDGSGIGDANRLKRQQIHVEAQGALFLPKLGCPGPVVSVLREADERYSRRVVLVTLDTAWLFTARKNGTCTQVAPFQVFSELQRVLAAYQNDLVFVAGHHPLLSGSKHGGFQRGAIRETFPSLIGWQESLGAPEYDTFVRNMKRAMSDNPPLIYAAGHDHALQVLRDPELNSYLLVSGAGAKQSPVTALEETVFARGAGGFMAIDLLREDDGVAFVLHIVEAPKSEPLVSIRLGTDVAGERAH
jgi:hypothetical protein